MARPPALCREPRSFELPWLLRASPTLLRVRRGTGYDSKMQCPERSPMSGALPIQSWRRCPCSSAEIRLPPHGTSPLHAAARSRSQALREVRGRRRRRRRSLRARRPRARRHGEGGRRPTGQARSARRPLERSAAPARGRGTVTRGGRRAPGRAPDASGDTGTRCRAGRPPKAAHRGARGAGTRRQHRARRAPARAGRAHPP